MVDRNVSICLIGGCLDFFQFGAVTSKADVNICIGFCIYIFIFLGLMPKSAIASLYGEYSSFIRH